MFNEEERRQLNRIREKSLELLDSALLENGALLASPPGERFPYVYPRDTALILRVLVELDEYEKVKRSLRFLAGVQGETGEWCQRYDKEGKPASYKPPQLDGIGLILYVVNKYITKSRDKEFSHEIWENIKQAMQYIKFHYIPELKIIYSINGLHEWPPMEAGFDIWGNICSYAGIRAAQSLAELREEEEAKDWGCLARELWSGIEERLIKDNSLVKLVGTLEITDPDVTEFAPYVTEVLPADDPTMRNTAEFIMDNLWNDELGGIERCYIEYTVPARDNGGHGPYSQYTGWAGQYYADVGDQSRAKRCAEWFIRYNRDGLLPEHVSTKERFDDWVRRAKDVGRFYRAGRDLAAQNVIGSREYKEEGLVLWVIPLVWGHAEFLLFYHKMEGKGWL